MANTRLKSRFASRPVVIGIDETNNNFGIRSRNPHHPDSSFIVTAYLGDDSRKDSSYRGSDYENKCGVFAQNADLALALGRGKDFLYHNPHFYYAALSPEPRQTSTQIIELRRDLIGLLTFKFILSYAIDPSHLQLVIDQIDGSERSREIKSSVEEMFEHMELDIPVRFMRGAENVKIPARKADRAGYWLAALHFLGESKHWPYRHRKVDLRSLDHLGLELQKMKERDYPEL
jgi:hypothetical protein